MGLFYNRDKVSHGIRYILPSKIIRYVILIILHSIMIPSRYLSLKVTNLLWESPLFKRADEKQTLKKQHALMTATSFQRRHPALPTTTNNEAPPVSSTVSPLILYPHCVICEVRKIRVDLIGGGSNPQLFFAAVLMHLIVMSLPESSARHTRQLSSAPCSMMMI